MAAPPSHPLLDRRALNRSLLARQGLLERTAQTPADALRHLVGMQAQLPEDSYIGLWSRIDAFDPMTLSDAIRDRHAVRIALMRSTIHLVTADDALVLRPLTLPVTERGFQGNHRRFVEGVDLDELGRLARAIVEEAPCSTAVLGRRLAERWPGRQSTHLAIAARTVLPLVQVPPRGLWGRSGGTIVTTLEAWLGRPIDHSPSIEGIVLRYLRAFGPASSADVRAWCGIPGLRPVLDGMRSQLVAFQDERGRELLDVPDGVLPDARTHAPVRFLPVYDNVVLAHDDRSRIVPDDVVSALVPTQENIGSVLVDGFVGGRWCVRRDRTSVRLSVEPIRPMADAAWREVAEEAERLLGFLARGAPTAELVLAKAG